MSNITPYTSQPPARLDRQTARTVSRYHAYGQATTALIDVRTDVAVAKVDAQSYLTACEMASLGRLAQVQRQIEHTVPELSGDLAMLRADALMGFVEINFDFRRQLRSL